LEIWKEVGYAHSKECETQFVNDFRTALQKNPTLVGAVQDEADPVYAWVHTLPKGSAERLKQFDLWNDFFFRYELDDMLDDLCFETKAMNLEHVGRFEEAAHCYETLAGHHNQVQQRPQFLDRARQAREKAKTVRVKQTVVDINKLLEQVRDGGIVAVYRCPHCGGKVKIGKDASVESLKVCEHCGSEIEAMELADFIRTALS
jgi:DNA-directed RNA polymerase subunit RPC12/RpoP